MSKNHCVWSLACLGLLGAASPASAGEGWELTLLGGWTAPAVTSRTVIQTDIETPNVPGTSFRQQGDFTLAGRGSAALGGSLTFYFNSFLGIEGRVDTVNFKVDVEGPVLTSTTPLTPLPPLTTTLDLSDGAVNVERLFPLSLNLKARTGGSVRFMVSAGVSFLPKLSFTAVQRATFGIGSDFIGTIPLASVAVAADGLSDVPSSERFGVNVGAGLEVGLSEQISFVGEARVFRFPTQTLAWRDASVAGNRIEAELLDTLRNDLGPLELDLTYFQVSGGLAIRF